MTAPPRATPRLSAVPATQNTAPVAEFRCLYTHDVRRKQKRWQDGFLKFHTFNSRVMVYDQSRIFLGDTYWKESSELQEGDELQLDKPIMVEVAEAMGITQTDLTPLFEKNRDAPQHSKPAPPSNPISRPAIPTGNSLRTGSQLRHKSLNTLLGTSQGPIGKAKPIISPYAARKEKENEGIVQRANKRQKVSHNPIQQTASGSNQGAEPAPERQPSLWARTADAKSLRPPPRPLPRNTTAISLDSEPDDFSSGVTLPSTPPDMVNPRSLPPVIPAPPSIQSAAAQPRTSAAPRIPKGKVPVPSVKALETPHKPPPMSSPPVSASNRIINVDFALQPVQNPHIDPTPRLEPTPSKEPGPKKQTERAKQAELQKQARAQKQVEPPKQGEPQQTVPAQPPPKKGKPLRLSTGVKRGMLLCQAVPPRWSEPLEPKRIPKMKRKPEQKSVQGDIPIVIPDDGNVAPPSKPVKPAKAASKTNKQRNLQPPPAPAESKDLLPEASPEPSFGDFDDMEFIHGLMDQQLAVTPSSPRIQPTKQKSPPIQIDSSPKLPEPEKTASKRKEAEQDPFEAPAPKTKKPKSTTSIEAGEKKRGKKNQVDQALSMLESLPSDAPLEHTETPSKRIGSVEDNLRPPSVSVSPKKVLLSTGGFRKKAKVMQKQVAPNKPNVPSPRRETVALPPHPLRSSRSGPLMSTTELSALLQKPPKPVRIEDDPIQDDAQNASPNRSFRRSRSENDAPIPSTSEVWEQENLPKTSKSNNDTTTASAVTAKPKAGGLAALVKRTDPRRKFQRTSSLNVNTANLGIPGGGQEVVTPPADDDVGPWSTEAFDLFDWRPPAPVDEEQGPRVLVDRR